MPGRAVAHAVAVDRELLVQHDLQVTGQPWPQALCCLGREVAQVEILGSALVVARADRLVESHERSARRAPVQVVNGNVRRLRWRLTTPLVPLCPNSLLMGCPQAGLRASLSSSPIESHRTRVFMEHLPRRACAAPWACVNALGAQVIVAMVPSTGGIQWRWDLASPTTFFYVAAVVNPSAVFFSPSRPFFLGNEALRGNSLPALPAATAEATESTATESTKSASLAKAITKATATEAITKAAALTPTTEPIAPTTTLETAEPVLACAARLLFTVRPRRVTPGGLPAARRVLLPTAAGVLVHVAVGVGIVIVANARRPERVGLARSRRTSSSAPRVHSLPDRR